MYTLKNEEYYYNNKIVNCPDWWYLVKLNIDFLININSDNENGIDFWYKWEKNPKEFKQIKWAYYKKWWDIFYYFEKIEWVDFDTFSIFDKFESKILDDLKINDIEEFNKKEEEFKTGYAKDKNNVYRFWKIQKSLKVDDIINLDYDIKKEEKQFEWYDEYYRKYWKCFCWWKILENVDYETFEILSEQFAKDKNMVWYQWEDRVDIKPKNFKVLFCDWYDTFAKNDEVVVNLEHIIEWADSETFEVLKDWEYELAKDKYRFYSTRDKTENLDVKTFKKLWWTYFSDKNAIYIWDSNSWIEKLEWSDTQTFSKLENYKSKYLEELKKDILTHFSYNWDKFIWCSDENCCINEWSLDEFYETKKKLLSRYAIDSKSLFYWWEKIWNYEEWDIINIDTQLNEWKKMLNLVNNIVDNTKDISEFDDEDKYFEYMEEHLKEVNDNDFNKIKQEAKNNKKMIRILFLIPIILYIFWKIYEK